ncbi:MAG: DUF2339 domain-containing protein [Candidatus Acidiferrales bacterium]
MDSGLGLLILLALLAIFAGPILAAMALSRISAMRRDNEQIGRLTSRVYELEQRLAALDSKIAATEPVASPPAAQATPELPVQPVREADHVAASTPVPEQAVTPPTPLPAPTLHYSDPLTRPAPATVRPAPFATRSPSRGELDVEAILGGKWLNYLGILALIFAVAFFLKYAFDNNWIGPGGRVGIGILIGGAMFPLSDWLLHRGYRYFSEGITGLGSAVLYLSIWAGWYYYALFSQPVAFALLIVITGLTVAVAIGRNSQRIAVLALAGGALTPLLISTGENAELTLFTYFAVLGAAMLAISWIKGWKSVPPLQCAATLIYFWSWYAEFYANYELATTLVFATIFFVMFAALPAVRSRHEGELSGMEIAIVVANALQYLVALRWMLWPEYRWWLAMAVLGLAALHLFAERTLPAKSGKNVRLARAIYAGLALTFASLAIPILLDGKWITIAWAIEGAVLVWNGLRIQSLALRVAGILLLAVAGVRLAAIPLGAGATFLLNARFLTMALCCACFLAAFLFASRAKIELGSAETNAYYMLAIAATVFFLAALSLEVWDLYGRMPSLGMDRSLAQNLALSVLWLIYAVLLLVGGVIKRSAVARWQALALLGVVIVKVFFFDLSFLERFYRIMSFFLLGLALLLISFFYQRYSASRDGEKSS